MATKSFLKNINIKNKKDCQTLINALENAKDKKSSDVSFDRSYHVASKDEISKIFGIKQ